MLVERLGPLGQHGVAVPGVGGAGHPRAVAPDVVLAAGRPPVGAHLVGRPLDPQATVPITARLSRRIVALGDVRLGVVRLDPGVDMLHVDRHGRPEVRHLCPQRLHGASQQLAQHGVVEVLLLVPQPAGTGHRPLHVEAEWRGRGHHRAEPQLQYQPRVLHQVPPQVGHVHLLLAELHQQRLDVRRARVRHLAGPAPPRISLRHPAPVQQPEERPISLDNRVGPRPRSVLLGRGGTSTYHLPQSPQHGGGFDTPTLLGRLASVNRSDHV
jgi:hypothetical protein